MSQRWALVRIGLVAATGVATVFTPLSPQADSPLGWSELVVGFAFSIVALVLVVRFQALNPRSAKVWNRPSWTLNPFTLKDPLQFFHFASYVCLAQGIVTAVQLMVTGVPFFPEAFVPLAMGGGALIGVWLVPHVLRRKFGASGA